MRAKDCVPPVPNCDFEHYMAHNVLCDLVPALILLRCYFIVVYEFLSVYFYMFDVSESLHIF